MKKIPVLLYLSMFLLIPLKELVISYLITKDNHLDSIIFENRDYLSLKNDQEELLKTVNINKLEKNIQIGKIIDRNPQSFFAEAIMVKGKKEGVQIQDIITNEAGYIGEVIKINDHTSVLRLLMNKDTQLSVRIGNNYGLLKANNDTLNVTDITSKEEIHVGDTVYTSGYSKEAKDIKVATVTMVKTGVSTSLIVKPIVDFNHLNYCYIERPVSYE